MVVFVFTCCAHVLIFESFSSSCSSREEETYIRISVTIREKDAESDREDREGPVQELRRLDHVRGRHRTRPVPRVHRPLPQLEEMERFVSATI